MLPLRPRLRPPVLHRIVVTLPGSGPDAEDLLVRGELVDSQGAVLTRPWQHHVDSLRAGVPLVLDSPALRLDASRLADLVPVRVGRMAQSAFAYYRGTAAVMAADLADAPATGIDVVCCGDAHVSNFGFFASPERTLLFDLNDFDEAGVAPWEWDVKRLAASVHIGGRDIGMSEAACRDASRASVAELAALLLDRPGAANCWLDMLDGDEDPAAAVDRCLREGVDAAEGEPFY